MTVDEEHGKGGEGPHAVIIPLVADRAVVRAFFAPDRAERIMGVKRGQQISIEGPVRFGSRGPGGEVTLVLDCLESCDLIATWALGPVEQK